MGAIVYIVQKLQNFLKKCMDLPTDSAPRPKHCPPTMTHQSPDRIVQPDGQGEQSGLQLPPLHLPYDNVSSRRFGAYA